MATELSRGVEFSCHQSESCVARALDEWSATGGRRLLERDLAAGSWRCATSSGLLSWGEVITLVLRGAPDGCSVRVEVVGRARGNPAQRLRNAALIRDLRAALTRA